MDAGPPIRIGYVIAAEVRHPGLRRLYDKVMALVHDRLVVQFPAFRWEIERRERAVYPAIGVLDPLPLLALGAEEKLLHRWDYVVVFVPNDLKPRSRVSVTGVPSSALETAVISSARFLETPRPGEAMAALVLHLLGHLFGAAHEAEGVMGSTMEPGELGLAGYDELSRRRIERRLARVADERVEEGRGRMGTVTFVWRTIASDPVGLVRDVLRYAPWRMPLHLGRYTAATVVTVVFLMLSAEAWEMAAGLDPGAIAASGLLAVLLAAAAVYFGQSFHEMGRAVTLREQLVRTRLVLIGALTIGMGTLWAALFLIALGVIGFLPQAVVAGWAGLTVEALSPPRFAAFVATLGVVAAALGGNLEDEDEIKAVLLFDEEA